MGAIENGNSGRDNQAERKIGPSIGASKGPAKPDGKRTMGPSPPPSSGDLSGTVEQKSATGAVGPSLPSKTGGKKRQGPSIGPSIGPSLGPSATKVRKAMGPLRPSPSLKNGPSNSPSETTDIGPSLPTTTEVNHNNLCEVSAAEREDSDIGPATGPSDDSKEGKKDRSLVDSESIA